VNVMSSPRSAWSPIRNVPVVGNADDVAGEGLVGDLTLTGEEKLRCVQGNLLPVRTCFSACRGRDGRNIPGKRDPVAVLGSCAWILKTRAVRLG